jgi:hypothetical protein
MISRLRQAGRRRAVLAWTLALVFAVAPALSIAFAAPAASFTNAVVHSHHHGDAPHSHHHLHHDQDRADGGMVDTLDTKHDGQGGHDRAHVHHDASCPSIVVPAPVLLTLDQQLSTPVDPPPTKALHGAPPSRLLRPPIV